jgi:hypothetical protein
MSGTTVHQCLHGYRRGHELLAGSMRLPPAIADQVTRLSDLSGSLASGWEFTSYLTGYPLAGTGYFALARTWEDKNATRAGCVLTHTLLIPVEAWRSIPCPQRFEELFAAPDDLRSEERFKKPLTLGGKSGAGPRPIPLPQGTAVDFVRKYYDEGHRPLVWFDCPDPEGVTWAVVRVLWPALREQFSWCTASLQPRSIDARFLDLQFAPSAAYPRFHKIPREKVISGEPDGVASEPWCAPCAKWIFSGERPGPVDAEIEAFGPCLREDPTLLRYLFLAHDLSERVSTSPTAGAGLLDIAETIAPGCDEAIDYKSSATQSAIKAAMSAAPEDALKCLYLVGERLMNTAFREVLPGLGPELLSKVDKLSAQHPREALLMPERVVSRSEAKETPYYQGLVKGLTRCAREAPSELICLQEFDKTAPHLIASSPPIAGGYLRGVRLAHAGEPARDALLGWIAGYEVPELKKSLRAELLPEVHDEVDVPLVEALLRGLPSDEVGSSLSVLTQSTGGFAPPKLLATLQEAVAVPFPEAVRQWAVTNKQWSAGTVSLVAATFTHDQSGLDQVMGFVGMEAAQRAELFAAYLSSCAASRVPGWFKDAARQSAEWLVPMVALGDHIPASAVELLERLLPELHDVPAALHQDVLDVMPALGRFPFWPSLVDLALRGAVTAFVEGRLSEAHCRAWFKGDWSSRWVGDVSRNDLASVLIYPVNDMERRERSFRWLAFSPSPLYDRQPAIVPGLFWELVSERRYGWTEVMGNAWAECIRRVQHATPGSSTLRMCADVLRFGFDHTGDTVGTAVAAAFYPVYRAVCDSNWTPQEVSNLFGWFDWDKAKELRKGLVRAFRGSNWSPGDMALAACEDEHLLRKLVKRTLRNDNGCHYVTSMLNDLVGRGDPGIARTVEIVRELASNPDFHEPWD